MEILKVDNLTKIYGKDTTKVVALDHVSFSVEKVLLVHQVLENQHCYI